MDERIRATQEYVYGKYIDPGSHGTLDEEEALRYLEEYYSRPEAASDPDCFYPGILYFERGFEKEEQEERVEHFRRAQFWLERHRSLTQEEWDVVDDRLLDIEDFLKEAGLDTATVPAEEVGVAVPLVIPTPHIVEEVDDNGPMMTIPAGLFLFGAGKAEVNLPAFRIDKYPVTNRQYEAFCRATGYRWPKFWTDERFNHPEAPVVGVSIADAVKYSRWIGKDLPTEEQWEKACRGSDGRLFPWGDAPPENGTVCCGLDPEGGHTDPVTAHPAGVSPFGVQDMVGNVWEWTSTSVEDGETVHVIKGGCYNDPPELVRSDVRLGAAPKDKHETIGFRCVKNA